MQEEDLVPPTITLTSPTDGALVSGSVSMSASATDDVGVAQIEIYLDGKLKCASTNSVSCSWNARKAEPGSAHTVSATATDSAGNTATASAIVTVASSGKKGGGKDGTPGRGNRGGKKK